MVLSNSLGEASNYKGRVMKEYTKTDLKLWQLKEFITEYEEGKLMFEPKTPIEIFKYQADIMKKYLGVLAIIAGLENIPLIVGGHVK